MIDEGEVRASDQLAQLTAKAHSVTNAAVSPELHGLGRRRLMAATLDLPVARSGWLAGLASFARIHGVLGKTLMLTSLTAAAAVAFYLSNVSSRPFGAQTPHALTYEIHGGQRVAANYVDALRDSPASVDFSDGTNIVASPGSRLRIDATQERGARVFVERGSATAHVTHRKHSTWLFIAGPFDVHITGTRFTLAWEPRDQAIDLTLHEGSVEVESPLGSSHCVVRAGQRFRASLATGTMQLENSDEQHSANSPAVSTTPVTSVMSDAHAKNKLWNKHNVSGPWRVRGPDHERDHETSLQTNEEHPTSGRTTVDQASRNLASNQSTASHATGSRATSESFTNDTDKRSESRDFEPHANQTIANPAPAADWMNLVHHGAFQAVVDAATARGIEVSLRDGTALEVRALADAARYTNRTDLAERGLNTLRERFSGTRQSAAAAFLLGRTLEARADMRDADHSYTTYLTEAPDGEFASEALAGHMRAVAALEGPAAAKPVALEYLRRYRSGVHADSARRLANGN